MKRLATSTLALIASAGVALAATHSEEPANTDAETAEMQGDLIRTRDITGGDIYTTDAAADEWSVGEFRDGIGADWNRIGEIEDVVLSRDGRMTGVVAEVGGFLDVGDKHVMLPVEDVNLVAVDMVDYAVVTRLNEEELEALDSVDEGFWQ